MVKRVLLIDDDNQLLGSLIRLIHRLGDYSVVSFGFAIDALRYLQGLRTDALPHIIITDYRMPRMSGLAFCQELRSNPKLASIPIVVASGDDIDELQNLFEGLSIKVLVKPINLDTLRGLLKEE